MGDKKLTITRLGCWDREARGQRGEGTERRGGREARGQRGEEVSPEVETALSGTCRSSGSVIGEVQVYGMW